MALSLIRERFGARAALTQLTLKGDFIFEPGDFPSLTKYHVAHEEVDVLQQPLAVDRSYFLTDGSSALKAEFALCLEGAPATSELLFRRAEGFQRQPLAEEVRDLTLSDGTSNLGFAWLWGRYDHEGVAGFVRHNVLVFLQGHYDTLLELARAVDMALVRIPAGAGPSEATDRSFDLGPRELAVRVSAGGRVDLGPALRPDETHFFIASGGSVNRDPKNPSQYYFRAGLDRGQQIVTVLRVGRGVLPARQTIPITIE